MAPSIVEAIQCHIEIVYFDTGLIKTNHNDKSIHLNNEMLLLEWTYWIKGTYIFDWNSVLAHSRNQYCRFSYLLRIELE